MIVNKAQFGNKSLRYILSGDAVLFEALDVAEVLHFEKPRKEVMTLNLAGDYKTELVRESFDKGEIFVADLAFIIDLAMRAETSVSRRFIEWLIKTSAIILAKAVDERERSKGNQFIKVASEERRYVTTEIAKRYGMSAIKLNNILNKLGVIYKVNGQWVLYEKYQGKDYMFSLPIVRNDELKSWANYWSETGSNFIDDLMAKNGYYVQIKADI